MEDFHILVVDDNPEIREIIQVLLEGEGMKVTAAEDGPSALMLIEKKALTSLFLTS